MSDATLRALEDAIDAHFREYIAPLGDPNAAVALAAWVSADINKVLNPEPDPD